MDPVVQMQSKTAGTNNLFLSLFLCKSPISQSYRCLLMHFFTFSLVLLMKVELPLSLFQQSFTIRGMIPSPLTLTPSSRQTNHPDTREWRGQSIVVNNSSVHGLCKNSASSRLSVLHSPQILTEKLSLPFTAILFWDCKGISSPFSKHTTLLLLSHKRRVAKRERLQTDKPLNRGVLCCSDRWIVCANYSHSFARRHWQQHFIKENL